MFSKKRKKEFLEMLRKNHDNITETCRKFGIDRQSFYLWKQKYRWFREQYKEISEGLVDETESELYKLIRSEDNSKGKVTAIIFHLKCKGAKRGWVERKEVERECVIQDIDLTLLKAEELVTYFNLLKKIQVKKAE